MELLNKMHDKLLKTLNNCTPMIYAILNPK